MRIVVTGANGFIGRNLIWRLRETGHEDIVPITRTSTPHELSSALANADFVFHLAGVNRSPEHAEFERGNVESTGAVCDELIRAGRRTPVAYASSTQALLDNVYGRSKAAAEQLLLQYARASDACVSLFRLTNVFGKWSRPHYNSAVATFCHQIARGLPIKINDPAAALRLVYVDDVVESFAALLRDPPRATSFVEVAPVYETTVGEVASLLYEFAQSRQSLLTQRVGTGFVRALYSTYVSYLPAQEFSYSSPVHGDPRGEFVEMLKTPDCGQFSYFTAHPGITRGEHYHHTKTEKFLVVRGTARFAFRSLDTGETHELTVQGGEGRIVETSPGWTHNITNIGRDELVVMLWANEIFDRGKPDTVAMKVTP